MVNLSSFSRILVIKWHIILWAAKQLQFVLLHYQEYSIEIMSVVGGAVQCKHIYHYGMGTSILLCTTHHLPCTAPHSPSLGHLTSLQRIAYPHFSLILQPYKIISWQITVIKFEGMVPPPLTPFLLYSFAAENSKCQRRGIFDRYSQTSFSPEQVGRQGVPGLEEVLQVLSLSMDEYLEILTGNLLFAGRVFNVGVVNTSAVQLFS